ncbi:MAG: PKD domain-containing protein [Flavobacteriaceae bacterium]|nr:MAG: PKD domain-containing protein [Flavobacteriaceae bacterium]
MISQEIEQDSIPRKAIIEYEQVQDHFVLRAVAPPLRQIAGAPKAFYTYFWEFGDGNYSFKKSPKHQFKQAKKHTVRLSLTNNYDDGLPPTTRPKLLENTRDVSSISDSDVHHLNTLHDGFRLITNRDPIPNQALEFVISYGNTSNIPSRGKIYLFYNELKYKNKNFELLEVRTYHNEQEEELQPLAYTYLSKETIIRSSGIKYIFPELDLENDTLYQNLPATLSDAKKTYSDVRVWNVNDVSPLEERNIFLTFKTTPEMLKDTSAIISIRSVYVPDRGSDAHQIKTKEMEIVTSHDPNKMAVYNTFLNYRLLRFKRLKYKVRFQNNGEGPARLIKLNVDIPPMLDKTTLKIIDMYPKVPICPKGKKVRYSCMDTVFYADKISFQFKNIYLPGTEQKGVKDKDSTKGFVKYSLKFGKKFHKIKSRSKTAIIFDKNEPIITNSTTSRFLPGISIGAKAGYNYILDVDDSKSYFIGATIATYKAYKWYPQAELMLSSSSYSKTNSQQQIIENIDSPDGLYNSVLKESMQKQVTEQMEIVIVPASIRYNVNGILGLGIGGQLSLDYTTKVTTTNSESFYQYQKGIKGAPIQELNNRKTSNTEHSFKNINYGVFGDFTIGASRIGPSLGARYIYLFNRPHGQLHFYAIWKF